MPNKRCLYLPGRAWQVASFPAASTPDNLESFDDNYFDKLCVEVYCFGDNWGRLERAKEHCGKERSDASLPQIAVAYVLNQPMDTYALIAAWEA